MKKVFTFLMAATLATTLVACRGLDVVGQASVDSFDVILDAASDRLSYDDMNGGWSIEAPDGSVRFIWSSDYSRSPLHDLMLEFDAQPFIDAGLDVSLLPDYYSYYEGKLMVGVKLGDDRISEDVETTAIESYEYIVERYRSTVGYHAALDHFNLNIGNGNLFEWAKDLEVNGSDGSVQDKDIVFVLDPTPLIAAGVDPDAVTGWLFARVTVEIDGSPVEVDKFLKPFDLR